MSRIIKCQVNDEYLLGSGVVIGAAGSHGDVILQLQFNAMWDGLSIIATFRDAMNEHPAAVMLMPSMLVDGEVRTYEVPVPAEAKAIAGRARMTLTGYSVVEVDGTPVEDSLTNTATAFFRVLESDSVILDDGSTNASFVQQIQAEINRAGKIIEEAEDAVDAATDKIEEFKEAENARKEDEAQRDTAEAQRESAEDQRESAEAERAAQELIRESNEQTRISNEEMRCRVTDSIIEGLDNLLAIQEAYILAAGGAL